MYPIVCVFDIVPGQNSRRANVLKHESLNMISCLYVSKDQSILDAKMTVSETAVHYLFIGKYRTRPTSRVCEQDARTIDVKIAP